MGRARACLQTEAFVGRGRWGEGGGGGGRRDTVVKMETAVFLTAWSFEETKTIWKSMRSFKNSKSHPEDKHY